MFLVSPPHFKFDEGRWIINLLFRPLAAGNRWLNLAGYVTQIVHEVVDGKFKFSPIDIR